MIQNFNISPLFIQKALYYSQQFEHAVYLNGNGYKHGLPNVLAFGSTQVFTPQVSGNFTALKKFIEKCTSNCYGYFSYDLKDEIDFSRKKHINFVNFPSISFFEAKTELYFNNHQVIITDHNPQQLFERM